MKKHSTVKHRQLGWWHSPKLVWTAVGASMAAIVLVVLLAVVAQNQDNRGEAAGFWRRCVQQCPGKDGVLRSCTPPERDGTSRDSLCNQAGRKEICGGQAYCCPQAGGKWTTDMTKCRVGITPPPTCKQECPGKDGVLRSCTPPERDGTSNDSLCNQAGRVELCNNQQYCCPQVGGKWTTDLSKCAPRPTAVPTKVPTKVPSPIPCVQQCPGRDGVLRSCTPPESDGTSRDSLCNLAGRVETCNNQSYCCPQAGGQWTTDMSGCLVSITRAPQPSVTPTPTE